MKYLQKVHNLFIFEEKKTRLYILLLSIDKHTLFQLKQQYDNKSFHIEHWKLDLLNEILL